MKTGVVELRAKLLALVTLLAPRRALAGRLAGSSLRSHAVGRSRNSTDPGFDCEAGYARWEAGWSEEKKLYCCKTEFKACEFDCEAGLAKWETGWSDLKKDYCCKTEQKGCKEPPKPFDCEAGLPKWELGWSQEKKDWCCANEQKGCTTTSTTTTTPPFDCDAGLDKWDVGWSQEKKDWCCTNEQKGCSTTSTTTTTPPFDCEAGFDKWFFGWSQEKRDWCCANEQKGCPTTSTTTTTTTTTTLPFDCEAGLDKWETGWSEAKITWCCENEEKGCKPPSKPFDCEAGLAKWELGWSEEKKTWCCENEQKGCTTTTSTTTTTTTTTKMFDCEAGLWNWEKGWSQMKKDYCCEYENKGCEETTTLFDCDAGLARWETGWSEEKKKYCCETAQKGCEDQAFQKIVGPAGGVRWGPAMVPSFVPAPAPAAVTTSSSTSTSTTSTSSSTTTTITTTTTTTTVVELPAVSIVLEFKNIKFSDVEDQVEGKGKNMRRAVRRAVRDVIGSECAPELFDNVIVPDAEDAAQPASLRQNIVSVRSINHRIASRRHSQPAPFDCNAGLANWEAGWSEEKKQYCCQSEQKGCKAQVEFDCAAGFVNWERGWSSAKKEFCCSKEQKGCQASAPAPGAAPGPAPSPALLPALAPAVTPAVAAPGPAGSAGSATPAAASVLGGDPPPEFDCAAGFDLWEAGWSDEKKDWCCQNEQVGCTITTTPFFDCEAGLWNFEKGWSDMKKEWCCANEQKGCPAATEAPLATQTPLAPTADINFPDFAFEPAAAPAPAPMSTTLRVCDNEFWPPSHECDIITYQTKWWLNVSGPCTTLGHCVQSPNYPEKYGVNESCSITLNETVRPTLTGMVFHTESPYDSLTINGKEYNGDNSPVGVIPTSTITWSSDFAGNAPGWQLCFTKRHLVLTTTTTPKPMVYSGCPVNVFAQFFPGSEEMLKNRPFKKYLKGGMEPFDSFAQIQRGKDGSTFLEVLVTEKPHTGNEELPVAMEIIKKAQGDLFVALKNALRKFVNFKPIVGGMYVNWVTLRPYSMDTCEDKMQRTVKEFSCSYTRRLVPWALYNECTNYIAGMSFSHDNLVTKLDKAKCRAWTHNFMKKWNYGEGVVEHLNDKLFDCKAGYDNWENGWSTSKKCWCCEMSGVGCDNNLTCPLLETERVEKIDYGCWCRGVCESKYGYGSPVCNIDSGRKLYDQPL